MRLLAQLLPPNVASAETFEDVEDVGLFAEEAEMVASAVQGRRRTFTTGRICARRALAGLGVAPVAILADARGAPRWPAGIVGSITHCEGYRASAVAWSWNILCVGIDAEPDHPLPQGVLGRIALPQEQERVHELSVVKPEISWDRLLFSAKETVYKVWYPLTGRWLGFDEMLISIDVAKYRFYARLLTMEPIFAAQRLQGLCGRWLAHDGLILTAIASAAQLSGAASSDR